MQRSPTAARTRVKFQLGWRGKVSLGRTCLGGRKEMIGLGKLKDMSDILRVPQVVEMNYPVIKRRSEP